MEKAWDKKALLDDLKGQGLPMLEETVARVAKSVFKWARASANLEGGVVKALAVPAIDAAESFVMPHIDKIDGEENRA